MTAIVKRAPDRADYVLLLVERRDDDGERADAVEPIFVFPLTIPKHRSSLVKKKSKVFDDNSRNSSLLLLRASSSSSSSALARALPARRGRVVAAAPSAAAAASRAFVGSARQRSAMSQPSSSPPSSLSASSLRTQAFSSAAVAMASSSSKKTVLVPIADGTEEMEAVIVADVLRRAGAEVSLASVEVESDDGKKNPTTPRKEVVCSRGVRIVADVSISEVDKEGLYFDAVVLPGGMPGAERLRDCKSLSSILERHRVKAAEGEATSSSSSGKIILAAICAAPQVVFDAPGRKILDNRKATAHPAFSSKLKDPSEQEARVVVDGGVVTSRGPGTAFEFALCLVERLFGKGKAEEVAGPMVMGKGMEAPLVVGK